MGRQKADGRRSVGTDTYEQTLSVKKEEQRVGKEVLKVRVPGVREEELLKGGWARVWDYGGLYLLCASLNFTPTAKMANSAVLKQKVTELNVLLRQTHFRALC